MSSESVSAAPGQRYRPDIDGLRAFAVLVVMLFHFGVPGWSGGYLGVDIFFVISGYLIIGIINRDLRTGSFSIGDFYARRARRIIPALACVCVATLGLSWLFLLPEELTEVGRALVAVASFGSNIYFWKTTSYFDPDAIEHPLLHTWSLAVEEQFYLLIPALLLVTYRWRVFWPLILIVGFCLSLSLAHWASQAKPTASFYLLPTRAWELLAGGVLALVQRGEGKGAKPFGDGCSNVFAICGAAMLIWAVVAFDEATPHPGLSTLVPVAGTLCLLSSLAARSWLASMLSTRPLRLCGQLSYSAYLWHQPLFVFAFLLGWLEHGIQGLVLVPICFALAYVSWRWVELPCRYPSKGQILARVPLFAGLSMLVLGSLCWTWAEHPGVQDLRVQSESRELLTQVTSVKTIKDIDCRRAAHAAIDDSGARGGVCHVGVEAKEGAPVAVLGDSHAYHLVGALDDALTEVGRSGFVISAPWCAPAWKVVASDPKRNPACPKFVEAAVEHILLQRPSRVLLVAEWANVTQGYRSGTHPAPYAGPGPFVNNHDLELNPQVLRAGLDQVISILKRADIEVHLIGSTPEHSYHVTDTLVREIFTGRMTKVPELPSLDLGTLARRNTEANEVLSSLAHKYALNFLDPTPLFCDERGCSPQQDDGLPLYSDDNHLNALGARRVVDAFLASGLLGSPVRPLSDT